MSKAFQKKYHYVYKLSNPNTGEYYFGSRSCKCVPSEDKYMGSMVAWKPDKNLLIKEIINQSFTERKDALIFEASLIREHVGNPLNRNYNIPGNEFCNLGRNFTDEHRLKLRKCNLGKRLSAEHKKKISNSNIGRVMSHDTKVKISNAISGIVRSDETKAKVSATLRQIFADKSNHPFYGKSLTSTHKANLRNCKKDKCKPVIQLDLNGNIVCEYASISMASNETKISKVNIRRVCNKNRNTAGGYIWSYKLNNI
jgi:group I intron endonuclease